MLYSKVSEQADSDVRNFEDGYSKYSKLVYVSHPFGGLANNAGSAQAITDILNTKELEKKKREHVYITPVTVFQGLYNVADYNDGLNMCLALLKRCAGGIVMCGDWTNSRGCMAEFKYAKENGIPIYMLNELI